MKAFNSHQQQNFTQKSIWWEVIRTHEPMRYISNISENCDNHNFIAIKFLSSNKGFAAAEYVLVGGTRMRLIK